MLTQGQILVFQLSFCSAVINVNHEILNHLLALFAPTWLSKNLTETPGGSKSARDGL